MLTRPTVFVIGAGASYEAGFPVGSILAENIADFFTEAVFHNRSGQMANDEITQTIHTHLVERRMKRGATPPHAVTIQEFEPFREAARIIKRGMHLSNSIDDFLHLHAQNAELQTLGKISIAYTIQNAEKKSKIETKHPDLWQFSNFRTLIATFYTKMFKLITKGVSKNDIGRLFRNCTIISFNYDRSLEFFMFHAIRALYNVSEEEASEVMKNLTIYHPYGSVGVLPFMAKTGDTLSYFGNVSMGSPLLEVASNIITYTEKIRDFQQLDQIRSSVSNAGRLVFLGFGFHEQNLNLLKPSIVAVDKEIYATAHLIPPTNIPTIKEILFEFIPQNARSNFINERIQISDDWKCADIFDAFYFPLSRA